MGKEKQKNTKKKEVFKPAFKPKGLKGPWTHLEDKMQSGGHVGTIIKNVEPVVFEPSSKKAIKKGSGVGGNRTSANVSKEKSLGGRVVTRTRDSIQFLSSENWNQISLGEAISYIIGGDWGKDLDFPDSNFVKAKVVRGTDFKQWKKDPLGKAAERLIKKESLSKRQLQLGDIVLEVSGGGPDQPVGRTIIINEKVLSLSSGPLTCSNFFRLMRTNEQVNPFYLNYYLTFLYYKGEFNDFQTQTTNLRNLNVNDF